jgi:hypothetical protein
MQNEERVIDGVFIRLGGRWMSIIMSPAQDLAEVREGLDILAFASLGNGFDGIMVSSFGSQEEGASRFLYQRYVGI